MHLIYPLQQIACAWKRRESLSWDAEIAVSAERAVELRTHKLMFRPQYRDEEKQDGEEEKSEEKRSRELVRSACLLQTWSRYSR